jgi:hypothetical protein
MPRKPRVQFPGAIYHIVTRGDGRRGLFHDEDHYDRLTKGLADEVNRSRWEVLAFCWMPNHIHLLLTTPEPNLSYESLLGAWTGEFGGRNAATSYRRFVSQGLEGRLRNPLELAWDEWVIGSKAFLRRMVKLAEQQDPTKQGRLIRRTRAYSVEEIVDIVAEEHDVDSAQYVGFRSSAPGREMAALICRRFTSSTLAQLSVAFGLRHPDSAANLVRRAKRRESESAKYRSRLKAIEQVMMKTENQV